MIKVLSFAKKNKASSFAKNNKVLLFAKKNAVMCIAALLALITAFIIPPDSQYAGYFDLKTLTCLFCTLAVVCALKNINFFYILAENTVKLFKNTRACVLALIYITFIGSMVIANDMALLTFLPLGYYVLKNCSKQKYIAFCFIMQTVAANLGGMLTPFGNPQNLYLYTKFNIPNSSFILIMLPSFLLSVTLITACCLIFVKPEPLFVADEKMHLDKKKSIIYAVLFLISVLMVFRFLPYYIGGVIILAVILTVDRKALLQVDYPLLLTFVFFFIFSGNVSRMSFFQNTLGVLLNKNVLLVSSLSCQFISNVPSAILLSSFTTSYPLLLIGVNIGGVGTLISSLASLITYRENTSRYPKDSKKYLLKYSLISFSFLLILLIFNLIIYK